jgi:hypothetical protein
MLNRLFGGPKLLTWPPPTLWGGETVKHSWRANFTSRGVARGGTLVLTDRSLVFVPNSIEEALGQPQLSWDRQLISDARLAKRGVSPISGAWRRRLLVELADGTNLFFVVAHAAQIAQELALQR